MDEDGKLPSYKYLSAAFSKAKEKKISEHGLAEKEKSMSGPNKQEEIRFKASHGLLVAFATWILLLHVLGIYLFTNGFLLTRLVLAERSECEIAPASVISSHAVGSHEKGCWHPKLFDRAIVVMIDALRYDFTVPFTPPEGYKSQYFHNALPILHNIASAQPKNAFLLPFIADPPTATMQRLKGLTTGTLPTFMDVGSSFAATAIDEDNLVTQLHHLGKRIVHLGDDTWHSLFPNHFDQNLTKAYDSFNVWDLHTVDNGVTDHIFPLVHASNTSQWDIIFAHYLGVDHAGHRYGPDHPAMNAKLKQMNDVIQKLVNMVDDHTLLVVMGDHGMDPKGDHGGESPEEVQSAIWMYSRKEIFGRSSPSHLYPPATPLERSVAQIDLVPTLSLLLGLPIPFNNLGTPIEEAFIGPDSKDLGNLLQVNRLTASQIHRYQEAYISARGGEEKSYLSSLTLWISALQSWDSLKLIENPSQIQLQPALESYKRYQAETLNIFRSLWARFDLFQMSSGIMTLIGTIIMLSLYAIGLKGDHTEVTPGLLHGSFGTFIGALSGIILTKSVPSLPSIQSTVYCTVIGSTMGAGYIFWTHRRKFAYPLPTSLWGWIGVVLTLLLCVGFASNSYTIWEDEILLYFLGTYGTFLLLSSLRHSDPSNRALGCYHSIVFLMLTRVASLSRLCREEQMPFCKSTYYASATSSTSSTSQLLIPFIYALFLPSLIRSYYEGTRSYQSPATLWIGFALRMGLVLSALYWVIDAADDGEWFGPKFSSLKSIKVVISQSTFAIAFAAGYPIFVWTGPLLKIETQSRISLQKETSSTPQPDTSTNKNTTVTIFGYGNVHGSRYMLLMTLWLLAIILVQKPMGGGVIAICAWQIFSLLELIDLNSLSNTSVGPTLLGFMGSFYYFKTGHQATLSSIQWETAFIPLKTIKYPWSPLLIILNTFGAQILCAIAVPGIVLWKQSPKQKGLVGAVAKAVVTHMLFYAAINLATSVWAGHLRRHLMLYRIFNPRFMTGAAVLLVIDIIGIFVALGGTRWSFLSLGDAFGWPW